MNTKNTTNTGITSANAQPSTVAVVHNSATLANILDEPVLKKYVCTVSRDVINNRAEIELEEVRKKTTIKGYRAGKAPAKLIKEMHQNRTFFDALDKEMRETIAKIAKDKGFRLAASPRVELKDEANLMNDAHDVSFEITYELLPEIKSADINLKSIKITSYEPSLTEEDLQKEFALIAKRNSTNSSKEGAAELGDVVIINTEGMIDGEAFSGGKLDNFSLELGSGTFIAGFEDQLIGASAGDSKIVTATFPADYHVAELSGREAQFFTKVLEIKKQVAPEVNDDLAKKMGFDNLDAMRADVREKIVKYYKSRHKEFLQDTVFTETSKILSFDVPPSLVEKTDKKLSPEDSVRRARLSLFLSHLSDEEKIEVSDADIMQFVIQSATQANLDPGMFLDFYRRDARARQNVKNFLHEAKVYGLLFDQISVVYEVKTRDEIDAIFKELEDKKTQDEASAEFEPEEDKSESLRVEHSHGHDHDHHHDHENCTHEKHEHDHHSHKDVYEHKHHVDSQHVGGHGHKA